MRGGGRSFLSGARARRFVSGRDADRDGRAYGKKPGTVTDGTGVCPYTSELGAALSAAWPGCNALPPFEEEAPEVVCGPNGCTRPCRMTGGGEVHSFRYDSAGRLVERRVEAGTAVVRRETYDFTDARRWRFSTSGALPVNPSTTEVILDDRGRIQSRHVSFAGGSGAILSSLDGVGRSEFSDTFEYDGAGRLRIEHIARTKPGRPAENVDLSYEYDGRGRLVAETSSATRKPTFRYAYGADGKVASASYHGITWTFARDDRGRVTDLKDGARVEEHYA